MAEKFTWWQGLIIVSAITSASTAVYSVSRARVASEKVLASLKGPPAERVSGPLISVVIPTWNEADYLPNLLTSLANQTYEPLEIIVADWNSSDATRDIATSSGARVVDVQESGVGLGRNAGAVKANGDFLLFLDADCILEPNMVELLMVELLDNEALLSHPRVAHYDGGIAPAISWIWWTFLPKDCTSRAVLIRKWAFEAMGGYRNIWPEDRDLGRRLMGRYGADSIVYASHVVCGHSNRRAGAIQGGRVKQVRSPEFPAVRNGIYERKP